MRRLPLVAIAAFAALLVAGVASARPGWAWMQFGVKDIDVPRCADTASAALRGEGFALADEQRWQWGAIYTGETSSAFGWISCFQRRGVMQVIIQVSVDPGNTNATRIRNRLAKYFRETDSTPDRVTVPATLGVDSAGVKSKTILEPGHRYRITVTGTVGFFSESATSPDSDGVYCYGQIRKDRGYTDVLPFACGPMFVNGVPLDEFAGKKGQIDYNPRHRYEVIVTGVSGRLTYKCNDQYPSDNSGSWTILVEPL